MKQRTRLSNSGDELMASMNGFQEDKTEQNNEIQLYRIKPQEHFIEAQVQEGDTLQAISLRFYCSISELKRINHIHKDNEIFAKRTIKVPVTPYSVLTELIPPRQQSLPQPSTSQQNFTNLNIVNLLQNPSQNPSIEDANSHNQEPKDNVAIDCNAVVLNSIVAPSVVPYTDFDQNDLASEDTQLLPNKEKISVEAVVVKELTSHGADFGLKWFHLVSFILVLGVVLPILYILFCIEPPKHSHIISPHTTR